MYGVTEDGHSVCCHVHGFSPYFYASVPSNFTQSHCGELKGALNRAVLADLKSNREQITEPILAIELVMKQNIYGYNGDNKIPFAKITVAIPRYNLYFTGRKFKRLSNIKFLMGRLIAPAKRLLEQKQARIPALGDHQHQLFESNMDFESRFMIDRDVVGCNWIQLKQGGYKLRTDKSGRK